MQVQKKYNETDLVIGLKNRDQVAFEYLYMNYRGALFTIINQIIPDNETASDILQEVFVTIWNKIEKYDPEKGKLFTWLLNVTRNAAINMTRSKQYKNSLKNEDISNYVYSMEKNGGQQFNINRIGLRKLVDGLKDEQKEVLDMAYFKGFTQEEIAKSTGLPLGTVKTRLRSAIMELRKHFR